MMDYFSVPKPTVVSGNIQTEVLSDLVEEMFSFYESNPPFYDESVLEPLKISATWASLLKQKRRQ